MAKYCFSSIKDRNLRPFDINWIVRRLTGDRKCHTVFKRMFTISNMLYSKTVLIPKNTFIEKKLNYLTGVITRRKSVRSIRLLNVMHRVRCPYWLRNFQEIGKNALGNPVFLIIKTKFVFMGIITIFEICTWPRYKNIP